MAECSPDYPVAGMQTGEELATLLRLVALMISVSVLFPWLNSARRKRMRIFFLHWLSGVTYVVSQFVLSVMVLNCWSSRRYAGPVIYLVKFVELAALNLWGISSVAIAFLLAKIVQSFARCRRVPSKIGSPRALWLCVGIALVLTTLSAVFWNGVIVTGGYFWVTNNGNRLRGRWISFSFGLTQMVAGFLMALAVTFTLMVERSASLKACFRTSNRVKFHFILTIFGTFVNIYNGMTLLADEFTDAELSRGLVIIGWCSRYVHIVADTGIIFGAFYALENAETKKSGTMGSTYTASKGGGGHAPVPEDPTQTATVSVPTKRAGAPTSVDDNGSKADEAPPGCIEAGFQMKPGNEWGGENPALAPRDTGAVVSRRRDAGADQPNSNGRDERSSSSKHRVRSRAASSVACEN